MRAVEEACGGVRVDVDSHNFGWAFHCDRATLDRVVKAAAGAPRHHHRVIARLGRAIGVRAHQDPRVHSERRIGKGECEAAWHTPCRKQLRSSRNDRLAVGEALQLECEALPDILLVWRMERSLDVRSHRESNGRVVCVRRSAFLALLLINDHACSRLYL